ncbi:hypothetical protein ACSAGD_10760 [Paramicrobacterium sp. CJ85]|uniref:hypothetical protein n=1 Tax=Paramicrobacterium sp. CJ85 TaxID=3445355 RepID=UPI003F61D7B6
MARYRNGLLPSSELVWFWATNQYGRQEKFRSTPGTAARIKAVIADAKATYGFNLYITSGPNVYRDLDGQQYMIDKYGVGQAAAKGYSSHGGVWENRDTQAVDFWNAEQFIKKHGRAEFNRLMKRNGLTAFLITRARGYAREEPWHVIDLNPYSAPSTGGTLAPGSSTKETKVKTYHKQDATARKSGRVLSPGERFYLHLETGKPQSNASNIVGNPGTYSITPHVYGQGEPGDIVELVLMWQKPSAKDPGKTNSEHYKERLVVDRDGYIRASREFKRGVSRGWAVYARLTAAHKNKGNVKITVFDSDAYLFIDA